MKFKKLLAAVTACLCIIGSLSCNLEKNIKPSLIVSAVSGTESIKYWNGIFDTSWYDNTKTEFQITTAEQLAGLVELNISGNTFKDKTIHLLNNFDLSNKSDIESMDIFEGTIEGNGHSISGLKNSFIKKNAGTIKEVNFNSSIDFQQQKTETIGIIANESSGTISGCNVVGTIIYNTPESQGGMEYVKETVYIGGICGKQSFGNIEECISSVNITRSTDHRESLMCIGGICAQSTYTNITKCVYNGTITANATPLQSKKIVYTNNVVYLDPLSKKIYYDCYQQTDWVDSKQYVGGICGSAQDTDFYSCQNTGSITCTNKIKEGRKPSITYETNETISSYTNEYGNTYYLLKKCYRFNEYKNDNPSIKLESRVGGICGNASWSELYGCSNLGEGTINEDTFDKICGYKDDNTIINEKYTTTTTTTTNATKKTTTLTTTKKSTIESTITTTIPSEELKLSIDKITLKSGEQYTISANQSNLTYSSNNKSVAIVSTKGIITALSDGEAIISVYNINYDAVQLKVTVRSNIPGDVNDDGNFSIADAVALQDFLFGRTKTLGNWQNADLCKDNRLDVFDMVLMRRLLIEK